MTLFHLTLFVHIWQTRQNKKKKGDTFSVSPVRISAWIILICTYLTKKTKQKEKRRHCFSWPVHISARVIFIWTYLTNATKQKYTVSCFTCAHFCQGHSFFYIFDKQDKTKRKGYTVSPVRISARRATAIITSTFPLTENIWNQGDN